MNFKNIILLVVIVIVDIILSIEAGVVENSYYKNKKHKQKYFRDRRDASEYFTSILRNVTS